MAEAHPKRDCPYCNKSIITSRLGKHFLGSCKRAFVEANKKRFTSEFLGYMSCTLKNEELIYINLATQSSCMKEKMIWSVVKKDNNGKKHQEVAKQLLQELGEIQQQEKPIEIISMNTLGGVDVKKVQDASGAFLQVISCLITHRDMSEDDNMLLQKQLDFAKKFLSEEALEELEQMAIDPDDKSDCAEQVVGLFPRGFRKEYPEVNDPDYLKKFRK